MSAFLKALASPIGTILWITVVAVLVGGIGLALILTGNAIDFRWEGTPAGSTLVTLPELPRPAQPVLFPVMMLLVIFLIYVTTLDLEGPPRQKRKPSLREAALLTAVLGADLVVGYLTAAVLPGRGQIYMYRSAVVLIVAWLARSEGYAGRVQLEFTRRHLFRSVIVSTLAGFWAAVSFGMVLPRAVLPGDPVGLLLEGLHSILLFGLVSSAYYHAYLQRGFESLFGPKLGVLASAAAVGALGAAPLLMTGMPMGQYLMGETFLVVPVTFFAAGYLYLRTRNLVAPALFWALLKIIPLLTSFS